MRGWRITAAAVAAALIAAAGAAAQGLDRQVRFINDSSVEIVEITGARAGGARNLLGEGTLPPGGSLDADFDDGSGYCVYDFRAVFADGSTLERAGVNVCEIGTFRYTD